MELSPVVNCALHCHFVLVEYEEEYTSSETTGLHS